MQMNPDELKQAYSKMKIAVVGDFILDEWWRGTVTRINPEAPVPVVLNPVKTVNLGGAGNVLLQLVKLGAQTSFYTVGGYDDAAKTVLRLTHEHPASGYYYCQDRKYATPHKLRIIGNDQHIVRVDEESTAIDEGIQDEMLEGIKQYIDIYDAFVLSDYNKGVLTPRVIHTIIELCNKESVPVFVDPKKDNFWEYGGCTLLKCSEKEMLAQCSGGDHIDGRGIQTLFAMHNVPLPMVVMTMGAGGYIAVNSGCAKIEKAYYVEAKETSGAGDTVMAVLSLEYLRTKQFFKSAQLANKAGAIVVQKPGIAHCTVEELCGEVVK